MSFAWKALTHSALVPTTLMSQHSNPAIQSEQGSKASKILLDLHHPYFWSFSKQLSVYLILHTYPYRVYNIHDTCKMISIYDFHRTLRFHLTLVSIFYLYQNQNYPTNHLYLLYNKTFWQYSLSHSLKKVTKSCMSYNKQISS